MARYRRLERDQQNENYVALAPTYELVLTYNEPPHIDSTLAVSIEEGQALHLKCTAGEGINEKTLRFEKEFQEVRGRRNLRSVSQHIVSFEDAAHSGVYECFARSNMGEEHSRKMRISTKAILPKKFIACDNDNDFCGSNGRCGVKNNDRICVCDPGYVGQQCEHLLVKDYLSELKFLCTAVTVSNTSFVNKENSILVTTVKVVAGAGGTLNITLVFLTLAFACLFFKERKRFRLLQSQKTATTEKEVFLTSPQNPYQKDDKSLEMANLTKLNTSDQKLSHTTRFSTLRKFHSAIRERLSSMSDTPGT
ncbi:EGF-like domain protein [Dictyocaulus viviparus]|uniref:EGF-like domain protein n=1 Tax=Dictyocaulus viviparus TaxID=29172 RepID=A0A0D8YDG3_DICVI|nr:EGF-like domain protein [Dictyocaulus viviparus]